MFLTTTSVNKFLCFLNKQENNSSLNCKVLLPLLFAMKTIEGKPISIKAALPRHESTQNLDVVAHSAVENIPSCIKKNQIKKLTVDEGGSVQCQKYSAADRRVGVS